MRSRHAEVSACDDRFLVRIWPAADAAPKRKTAVVTSVMFSISPTATLRHAGRRDRAIMPSTCSRRWRLRQKSQVSQPRPRSEEHTSELQSLMRISYTVFCLKKKRQKENINLHYTSY